MYAKTAEADMKAAAEAAQAAKTAKTAAMEATQTEAAARVKAAEAALEEIKQAIWRRCRGRLSA